MWPPPDLPCSRSRSAAATRRRCRPLSACSLPALHRTRLLENEIRVLRDESNRLTHEKAGMAERVKVRWGRHDGRWRLAGLPPLVQLASCCSACAVYAVSNLGVIDNQIICAATAAA